MSESIAEPDQSSDLVDQLVRTSPPEWKRLAVLAGVFVVIGVLAVSCRPLTSGDGGARSGDLRAVRYEIEMTNRSLIPHEVLDVETPAGVASVSLAEGPVRLSPLTSAVVVFVVEGVDCDLVDRYARTISLNVRSVPIGWARGIEVRVALDGEADVVQWRSGSLPPGDPNSSGEYSVGPEVGWLGELCASTAT